MWKYFPSTDKYTALGIRYNSREMNYLYVYAEYFSQPKLLYSSGLAIL